MPTLTTIVYVGGPFDGGTTEHLAPLDAFSNRINAGEENGFAYFRGADDKFYWKPVPAQISEPEAFKYEPQGEGLNWDLIVKLGFWAVLGLVVLIFVLMPKSSQTLPPVKVPLVLDLPFKPVPAETPRLGIPQVVEEKPSQHPDWVESPGWPSGVPRAERVDAPWVEMPYGEKVRINLRGELPNSMPGLDGQNLLPRSGNHVGDAFKIGKNIFVWVTPNGHAGQWIDPVQ